MYNETTINIDMNLILRNECVIWRNKIVCINMYVVVTCIYYLNLLVNKTETTHSINIQLISWQFVH